MLSFRALKLLGLRLGIEPARRVVVWRGQRMPMTIGGAVLAASLAICLLGCGERAAPGGAAAPQDQATKLDRGELTDAERVPKKEGPVFLDQTLVEPALPACSDYSREPNNSGRTATVLVNEGMITGWEICYMFDVDQYRINISDVQLGMTLTVMVLFTHSEGDVEAALMDPNGQIISVSRSSNNIETVRSTTAGTLKGDYILGVWSTCCDQTDSRNKSGAAIKYDLNIVLQ
jgi:hypothetical protein